MESLEKVGLTNIEVGTVEAFQSREKRVIILSCVRANCTLFAHDAKFQLGFLNSAEVSVLDLYHIGDPRRAESEANVQ